MLAPMQTLGEKLQEARQRLGVTLREAAEFTKLRTDIYRRWKPISLNPFPWPMFTVEVS